MVMEVRSQTIVSNNPAVYDQKINDFLNEIMTNFEADYGSDEYEISITANNITFYQDDQFDHPLAGTNFIIMISEREEEEL